MPSEERWNCHEHRDELQVSFQATVYHHLHGQLCYTERTNDCYLHIPIQFKDTAAAYRWIEKGCIADLQEGMGTLQIGFTTKCLTPRETWWEREQDRRVESMQRL